MKRNLEEEKEEAECEMAFATSFIQANIKHSIAASRVLSRTASFTGIDIALIQKP